MYCCFVPQPQTPSTKMCFVVTSTCFVADTGIPSAVEPCTNKSKQYVCRSYHSARITPCPTPSSSSVRSAPLPIMPVSYPNSLSMVTPSGAVTVNSQSCSTQTASGALMVSVGRSFFSVTAALQSLHAFQYFPSASTHSYWQSSVAIVLSSQALHTTVWVASPSALGIYVSWFAPRQLCWPQ